MTSLREVFVASTRRLTAELAELRAAFDHNPTKGSGGEGVVIDHLRRHLPTSVGLTSGQIMDHAGNLSPQVDIIVYDATRCPMIFTSPSGDNTVPVEGVLACIEVKFHLNTAELKKCVESAQKIKRMERKAYLPTAIQPGYHFYDRAWTDLPIYYTILAFETDNLYAGMLNELNAETPPQERIDTLGYLDRGVTINAVASSSASEPNPISFGPTSTNRSLLVDVETDDALLVWFLNLTTMLFQANTRPIDLAAYAQEALCLSAKPSTKDVERVGLAEQIMDWKDLRDGRTPGTLKALNSVIKRAGTTMSPNEWGDYLWHIAELLEKGGAATMEGDSLRDLLRQAKAIDPSVDYPSDHSFTSVDLDVARLRAAAIQLKEYKRDGSRQ